MRVKTPPPEPAPAAAPATPEALRHTAALAQVQITSALKGDGIPALRTHLAALADI